MNHATDSNFCHIAKITLLGTGFAAAGAVLTTYVPAFHAPVSWLQDAIHKGNKNMLSKMPGPAGEFFAKNPLLDHPDITEFFAINAMETGLVAGLIVTLGGILGIAGVPKETLAKLMPLKTPCDHTH